MDDPVEHALAVLGLGPSATVAEIRSARRRLAMRHHPDHGGDPSAMRELNAAFEVAVRSVLRPRPTAVRPATTSHPTPTSRARSDRGEAPGRRTPDDRGTQAAPRRVRHHVESDVPSFTIDVLPAEAFEALLVVATWIGEVLVDDPPYLLDVHLHDPAPCWCRLELLPDAGGTTVNLTIASVGSDTAPAIEAVRDAWVDQLNRLGTDPGDR